MQIEGQSGRICELKKDLLETRQFEIRNREFNKLRGFKEEEKEEFFKKRKESNHYRSLKRVRTVLVIQQTMKKQQGREGRVKRSVAFWRYLNTSLHSLGLDFTLGYRTTLLQDSGGLQFIRREWSVLHNDLLQTTLTLRQYYLSYLLSHLIFIIFFYYLTLQVVSAYVGAALSGPKSRYKENGCIRHSEPAIKT